MNPRISIIMPVMNEAAQIVDTLKVLQYCRQAGHEVIVVDGGSQDATCTLAQPLADKVLTSSAGRAVQMNTGAEYATGQILWFLHADTHIPSNVLDEVMQAQASGRRWGRFDVQLSGKHLLLRVVETMMNWRSRLTAVATGDQGIFIERTLFEQVGGFPAIPLMEDVAMSKRLRRQGRPFCSRVRLITSSRRWETRGVLPTIFLMWQLRLAYFMGVSPQVLADRYR